MIVDAADLPSALREAAASGGRQRVIAVARGGVHRARAVAARFPFLDVRVVHLDDEAVARALAGCVPAGCDGVVVPGEPRLARLIADRTGCRWSAGSAAYLRRREAQRPWIMSGQVLGAAPVRALAQSLALQQTPPPLPLPAGRAAGVRHLPMLQARMERELETGFAADDGPAEVAQPDAGWAGRTCPDLRTAQRQQRELVAAGVVVQRAGRVLRVPLGSSASGSACAPPPAGPQPEPVILPLHAPAEAAPAALLARISAAMAAGARCVVVLPLADIRDREDLAEDLRLIARRCPFLDIHLAEPVSADERAALLAPLLHGRVRLCGADRGGLAELAERLAGLGVDADPASGGEPWDADDWSDPASDELLAGRRAAALADRTLMPEPWQEVAQALAQGEAHHGGGAGEQVSTADLRRGPAMRTLLVEPGATDLAATPISPQAAALVEPVAAAEALGHPARQSAVLASLERGLGLLTGLPVERSPVPGWIGLRVPDPVFMLRAVVVQGILARRHDGVLWLPAGPDFAPRREVRSILTAVATAVLAYGELRAQEPAISR